VTVTQSDADVRPLGGADLDPDIRRFVCETSARWALHPDLSTVSPAEARRIAEAVRAPWTGGGPAMAEVREQRLPVPGKPEVRVRVHDPGLPAPRPVVVYLHGGGWTIFSLDTHDRVMREYAARARAVVVGVDYALSPEAKYPVALDQVCHVVQVMAEGRIVRGLAAGGVVLAGDSAGANLAVAAALRLRDEGRTGLVRGLVLNYGVFDRATSAEADRRFGGHGYMLSGAEMEVFWRNYLRDERDAQDPLVCPVRAELRGLPPVLMIVPECDVLAEQSRAMAVRLGDAGVPVTFNVYPGATHSFLEAVSIAPLADRALAETGSWLRVVLSGESS
jgi:acetyl esterase